MQGTLFVYSQAGTLSSGFCCPRVITPTIKKDDGQSLRLRCPNCSNVVSDRPASTSRAVPAGAEKKVASQRSRHVPHELPPRSFIPRPLEFLWFRKSTSDILRREPTREENREKATLGTVKESTTSTLDSDLEDLRNNIDLWEEAETRGFSSCSDRNVTSTCDRHEDAQTTEDGIGSIGGSGREDASELPNLEAENVWGWRPHLINFLLFWNRSKDSSGTLPAVDAQIKQNVTETIVRHGAEALSSEMADSKPVGANVWALGQLLHWKTEQKHKGTGTEGQENRNAGSGAVQEIEIGACKECLSGSCQLPAGKETVVEVPDSDVVHTALTMERFLGDVYSSDLRRIGLMSVLCDMAYTIPTIEPAELEKKYRLKFRTSSLAIKAKSAAEEKARALHAEKEKEAKKMKSDAVCEKKSPKDSLKSGEIASGGSGTFLNPTASAALPPVNSADGSKSVPDSPSAATSDPFSSPGQLAGLAAVQSGSDSEQAGILFSGDLNPSMNPSSVSLHGDEEATVLMSSELNKVAEALYDMQRGSRDSEEGLEVKGKADGGGEESASQNQAESGKKPEPEPFCPCEWFACDDEVTGTRHFVIQGSDSLASWQTNVSFDPVPFEDPSLGVKVHRGIYDAAKALYRTIVPAVTSFLEERGNSRATISLTGHSLGGSLATLLNFMLLLRNTAPSSALLPVVTFGSPSIMCGGDHLLETLGLPKSHIQQVMMHRDLVPRAFACTYPDHVAEVLRRMSSAIRDHSCLIHQKLMYAPMGTMLVLQPEVTQSPFHPLLPAAPGLFKIRHPHQNDADLPHMRSECHREVRAAQRAILNNPHPLEILADRGSYGTDGAISRDHDPRNYTLGLSAVLRREGRRMRRVQRERRRQMWWPLVGAEALEGNRRAPSGMVRSKSRRELVGVGAGVEVGMGAGQGGGGKGLRAHGPSPSCNGIPTVVTSGRSMLSADVGLRQESKRRLHSLIASKHVELGLWAMMTYSFLPLMQLDV